MRVSYSMKLEFQIVGASTDRRTIFCTFRLDSLLNCYFCLQSTVCITRKGSLRNTTFRLSPGVRCGRKHWKTKQNTIIGAFWIMCTFVLFCLRYLCILQSTQTAVLSSGCADIFSQEKMLTGHMLTSVIKIRSNVYRFLIVIWTQRKCTNKRRCYLTDCFAASLLCRCGSKCRFGAGN